MTLQANNQQATQNTKNASRLRCTVSALALVAGVTVVAGTADPAHAFFDRYVLVQPIQVCDDGGSNCAPVDYFHIATARTFEQANVLPIFLPLSQFNDTALLNSNQGPGDFSNGDGGSGDADTINMWFTGAGSIDDCGGPPGPGLIFVGCADGSKKIVIDGPNTAQGDTTIHTGIHSNVIAHEMGHNYGLGHVGDSMTLTTRLMNPIIRTDSFFNIGVTNFLLTAGEIATIRGDSKSQSSADCDGDGGDNVFNLAATDTCLDINGLGGDDTIVLNFGSGVLDDINGGSGNDQIVLLNGSIVGDDIFGGLGNDAIIVAGIVMGNISGGSDNDFIDIQSTAQVVGDVDGGSGNDTIIVAADPADILGGLGNDVITLNTGAVADNVYGDNANLDESGDGDDTIVMNDGTVIFNVDGEGGNDTIRILGGDVGGDVLGGGGNDLIETAEPATVVGNVDGEAGDDIITIASDPADILGGIGNDIITLNAGAVAANVYGDDNDGDEMDDGDDIINLIGGSVSGEVDGEGGDDTFNLAGTTITGTLFGSGGADIITQTGGSVGAMSGGDGTDLFNLAGGSVGGNVDGGANADAIFLTGTSVTGNITGGDGADLLNLSGGSVGGNVDGGANADAIFLTGTTVTGNITGSGGSDLIIQSGGSVTDIDGGADGDLIQILGGVTNGAVLGGDGNDVILTDEPATITGNVDGGAGNDVITIASDPADILGGTGDDIINIEDDAVTGSVYGDDNDANEADDGNDTINLNGGSVTGAVFGEGGNDTINQAGSSVNGDLSGGGGNDTFTITGGSAIAVLGGADNDTATWTGGTITTAFNMGTGTDTLDIYGVNAGGTALQAGLMVLDGGDNASSADGSTDTLNLRGVVEVLTELDNWEIINLVDTSVGDLGDVSRSIETETFFIEEGSTLIVSGIFGFTETYEIDGDLPNDGVIDMRDALPSYDELEVTGTYTGGTGSRLRTDTFLGGLASPSDLMIVGTATAGETALWVFDTNAGPGAYNPDGIPIVDVSAGVTSEDHFSLVNGMTGEAGPIDKGLFFYDLALRPDNVHVLIGVPDLEAFQAARIPTMVQSAWHATTGVWHDRTSDMRAYLDGSMPAGSPGGAHPGLWLRATGNFIDRSDVATFDIFNQSYVYNTSYDQHTHGVFAGLDWMKKSLFCADDAGMIGLYGGYEGWTSEFEQQNSGGGFNSVDASGFGGGVYATYLNSGFFLDGIFKIDFLDVDVNFPGVAPFAPTMDTVDSRSLGGVIDVGHRFDLPFDIYVEALGTLDYVSSDVGTAEIGGSSIDFGKNNSFRGRLGLGVGGTRNAGNWTLMARLSGSVWHEFKAENETEIFSPAGPPLVLTDDYGGTFGEISAVINVYENTRGISFFVKTDYRFGRDTSESDGSIGMRYKF